MTTRIKADNELDDRISLLYSIGSSMREVAKRLGISHYVVEASLRRTKTKTRSLAEAYRLKHGW